MGRLPTPLRASLPAARFLPCLALVLVVAGGCRNLQRDGRAGAELPGSVHYLERLALPPDAELHVRLVEPGPSGAPGARGGPVAEERLTDLGQPPFDFRLVYDPRLVQPGRVLRLEAEIRVGGRTWFRGARSVAELHAGPPTAPIELRVHRVAS